MIPFLHPIVSLVRLVSYLIIIWVSRKRTRNAMVWCLMVLIFTSQNWIELLCWKVKHHIFSTRPDAFFRGRAAKVATPAALRPWQLLHRPPASCNCRCWSRIGKEHEKKHRYVANRGESRFKTNQLLNIDQDRMCLPSSPTLLPAVGTAGVAHLAIEIGRKSLRSVLRFFFKKEPQKSSVFF